MRRNAFALMLAVFAATLFAAGISSAAVKSSGKVDFKLAPLPTVKGAENGTIDFRYGKEGGPIRYTLHVKDVENATMGHIHEVGDNGAPGAILAWIYPSKGESPTLKVGKFSGTLVKGEITASRLEGPLKGKSTSELFTMLREGKAGVAIHTKQNPDGELWGYEKVMEHKKM